MHTVYLREYAKRQIVENSYNAQFAKEIKETDETLRTGAVETNLSLVEVSREIQKCMGKYWSLQFEEYMVISEMLVRHNVKVYAECADEGKAAIVYIRSNKKSVPNELVDNLAVRLPNEELMTTAMKAHVKTVQFFLCSSTIQAITSTHLNVAATPWLFGMLRESYKAVLAERM